MPPQYSVPNSNITLIDTSSSLALNSNIVATYSIIQDSSWFVDSKVIDHITSDHTQLATSSSYQEND